MIGSIFQLVVLVLGLLDKVIPSQEFRAGKKAAKLDTLKETVKNYEKMAKVRKPISRNAALERLRKRARDDLKRMSSADSSSGTSS